MKISCDVDCTPEEARRFMGLPDISPVHDAYVARMTKAVDEGMTADMVGEMIRSWGPMSQAGTQMWTNLFEGMAGASRKR